MMDCFSRILGHANRLRPFHGVSTSEQVTFKVSPLKRFLPLKTSVYTDIEPLKHHGFWRWNFLFGARRLDFQSELGCFFWGSTSTKVRQQKKVRGLLSAEKSPDEHWKQNPWLTFHCTGWWMGILIKGVLVGGFNPFEKYARQNGNLPRIEVKIKMFETTA